MVETLIEQLAKVADGEVEKKLELLRRYLQRITVRKVCLSDFQPSKRTLEKSDVPLIVQEFEHFLSEQFSADSDDELPVIEVE